MIRSYKIQPHQIGLHFRDDQFIGVRKTGRHFLFALFRKERIEVVSTREVLLQHRLIDEIAKSDRTGGSLDGLAKTLDLGDQKRALVWVDGRFFRVLGPGAHVLWSVGHDVSIEIVDANMTRLEHVDIDIISRQEHSAEHLDIVDVQKDHVGVYFRNGRYVETLNPGRYAFWKKTANTLVISKDMRERMLDVAGQDVMTADHVTLRLNAVVAYKVADARVAVGSSEDLYATLYREVQLVLRDLIGGQSLDALLSGKEQVVTNAQQRLSQRAAAMGLEVISTGIRDIILPGEMKDLLNQVTAAKKAAEANLISRREETAAIRSQANTAKLLDASPTLMRLRELEVLEKIASNTNLQVLLNDGGSLSDQVTKLI